MNYTKHQIPLLVLSTILIAGCASGKKEVVAVAPIAPVVQSSTKTVAELQHAQHNTIQLKGTKQYTQNQAINFTVDTKGKTGYLYIIYADNKGQTTLLYPNAQSPLTELNGQYVFPRDFGGMNITATKECKGCKEEKTTVYAILSKDQISDIKNLKINDLTGQSSGTQSKGLSMGLRSESGASSDINIGKIEFFVK